MSNFSTAALLDLQLDQQSLRSTKQEISDSLDDVTVEVSAGGAMPDTGRGRSGPSSRDAMRSRRTQTEHLEDAVYYLESIDDHLSEGGLAGGAGGMMAEILGIGGDFAAEGAGAAADTVTGLATDVAGAALGQAAGSVIARQISGSTVGIEPNPLPVEGGGSGGSSITVSPDVRVGPTIKPTFKPTFQPDLGPDINFPDLNLGIPDRLAVNREPLPVQRDPLPVEKIGPIPVEEVGPIGIDVSTSGAGSTSTGQSSSNRSLDELFDDSLESAGRGGATGAALGAVGGAAGGGVGAIPGAVAGGVGGTIVGAGTPFVVEGASRIGSALSGDNKPTTGTRRSRQQPTEIRPEVDYSPTYNLEIDPRRFDQLATQIADEVEQRVDRDIDDVRDRVDQLESELEDLERGITRGR
ncbi:hypothetical protein DJ68_07845 [Halorubrum sp. C3]|nr:hypothetical protein DJ68_07845 [Halorubrum sp. C3]